MESSFKNPILEDQDEDQDEDLDLSLVFDYPNIKNETFGEILSIIKHSPSLVNGDIISIGEELCYRMQEKLIEQSYINLTTIKNLYYLIRRIPNTYDLQSRFKLVYDGMLSSPISSPVSPPPQPKKMKKPKSYLKDKMCPC